VLRGPPAHASRSEGATYITIGLSVLADGATAAPLAERYADWFESQPRNARASLEGSEVREVRWRFGVGHLADQS